MKKIVSVFVISGILGFSSCTKVMTEPDLQIPGYKSSQNMSDNMNGHVMLNFRAHLTGDQEVPPRESSGVGEVIFQLSKDGMELSYKLIVANLDNLSMSHIHVAPAGSNGPVVVWLYPPAPPAVLIPGTTNGILQEGIITKANLTGTLAGNELSDLVDLMVAGNTYVNVHTSQFPGGEIRGQIKGNN